MPIKRDFAKEQRFLRQAFGRKYLPYIYAIRKGAKSTNGKKTIIRVNIGVLRKHMGLGDQRALLPKKSIVIGSYFSLHSSKNSDFPYCDHIKLVCTPFNDNPKEWRKRVKHVQLCESDMVDGSWVSSKNLKSGKKKYKKKHDLFVVTEFTKKGLRCKGFQMLLFLIDMEKELGLRVCILDTATKKDMRKDSKSPSLGNYIREITRVVKHSENSSVIRVNSGKGEKLNQSKMNGLMQSSKFLLVGNTNDASPKIITESLIRGVPVILNKNILGGRKYINENNGVLFDGPPPAPYGEPSIEYLFNNYDYYKEKLFTAIENGLRKEFDPTLIIKEYYSQWGLANTAKKLAININKTCNTNLEYAFYPQFRSHFKKKKNQK